jgi:hypothetical protein
MSYQCDRRIYPVCCSFAVGNQRTARSGLGLVASACYTVQKTSEVKCRLGTKAWPL